MSYSLLSISLVIACTEMAPVEAESIAVYGSRHEMVVGTMRRSHYDVEQVVPSLLSDDDRRGHMMPPTSRDQAALVSTRPYWGEGTHLSRLPLTAMAVFGTMSADLQTAADYTRIGQCCIVQWFCMAVVPTPNCHKFLSIVCVCAIPLVQ